MNLESFIGLFLKTVWGLQASVGAISNFLAISFFYHIARSKNRPNNQENFLSRMLLILTGFDLLVCVFALGRLAFITENDDQYQSMGFGHNLFTALLFLSSDITAFLTCIMTVTRTISLLKPRHVVKRKLVYFSIFVYNVVMVTSSGMFKRFPTEASLVKFLILVSILISVVMSNIVCINKLRQTRTTRWKRRATVTVAILSLVFCVTNIGYISLFGRNSFKGRDDLPYGYRVVLLYTLPLLNSSVNAIVLITRSKKMRGFVQGHWDTLTAYFKEVLPPNTTRSNEEIPTNPSLTAP